MTTAPHLGRPLRRFGRWLVTLGTVAEVTLLTTVPLGAITGLALGLGAGALVHLALGSPGGRPTPGQVARSLADLGIPVREVHEAELAPRGVALMEATSEDGRPLLVKVYGRDAWDGQLFNVVWSYLWYRNETPNLTLSRLQQVEHEAFLNLLAERAGVPVQPAVAAGMADEDALLVVEIRARWLRSIDDDQVTEELAHDLWRSLLRMHEAGIAHGAIDDDHLAVLPDGSGAIGGFGRATAAPTPAQIRSDRAQLLVATARRLGDTRAIAAAKAEMGAEALADVLPFIQRAAMTPPTRRALKEADDKLDTLREAAAAAAGAEAPKLEPIRRVTWSSVILIVILVAAAWAVIAALSNVGVESIVSELKSADPAWLWAALLVSPSVQVAEAFSTLGACPVPLTLGPVIGLQFAIRFIALAVPSSAARIALNVRFFQRAGLAASPAIAVGMVDSVAGFLVQVVLLVLIWVTGLATLTTSLNGAQLDINGKLVAGVAILVVLAVAALFLIPRIRNLILPRLAEAAEALKVLKSPAKDLELFAGNLAAQVFLAMVLGACLRAFGQHATLAELILVNTLASLLSGVLPVPGGIGVMEAAISGGLIAVGIPESAALSTAIMFSLVTFYLPPIWGAVAMRNLRRRGYI